MFSRPRAKTRRSTAPSLSTARSKPATTSIGKFAAPLCAVYPENDPVTTHDNVLAFQQRMKDAGNDCEAWFIAAGSGWSNPKSRTYNPVEDKEAWKVALPFLVRIGAEPVKPKATRSSTRPRTKSKASFNDRSAGD